MTGHDAVNGMARADFCRFLAACYYEPAQEFSDEQLFDSIVAAATQIDVELAAHARELREQFTTEKLDDLLVDYTRLFLGPTHIIANPYGSIWLAGEGTVMQDSTMAVLELYREGGFDIDEGFRELPDHIAAELEFLYLLIYRENEAKQTGDTEAATSVAGLRRRFLAEHLGRWVKPFTAAARAGAQSAFYRQLAEITDLFVTSECRRAPA